MSLHRMNHCKISSVRRHLVFEFLVFCVFLYQINSQLTDTTSCMFNICSVNFGYCTNGGTCKLNKQCLPECECPPDFTGRKCEILNRNDSCPNICSPETCNFKGSCSQDPATCNITCNCSEGYAGDACNEPQGNSSCLRLSCVHGRCVNSKANEIMCLCDDQWIGDTCNIPCKKNCTRGNCINVHGNETCQCPGRYTRASNCTEESEEAMPHMPHDVTSAYLVILIVIPVIFLLAFILIVYLLWRKRMIFVMKIVYYLQKYEDSDGKIYDAFISFRSSKNDEYWVLNTLFPMLENEMGFKICVHYRDFLAGETISNNIIDAIEKSRRTIIVVSPDYVNGEWTRMEYQVAQQEMLNLRHKIIPIMFRDIDDMPDVDKNLKLILKSITYIKWPTSMKSKDVDRFWEQLRLTMPKKHEVKSTLKGGVVINEWSADTKL